MADIARAAGASISTVSHVVNGTRRVSENAERAVREALQATGYTHDRIARSLATGRTRTIGLAMSCGVRKFDLPAQDGCLLRASTTPRARGVHKLGRRLAWDDFQRDRISAPRASVEKAEPVDSQISELERNLRDYAAKANDFARRARTDIPATAWASMPAGSALLVILGVGVLRQDPRFVKEWNTYLAMYQNAGGKCLRGREVPWQRG